MGHHPLRGRSEDRRESISYGTDHFRHTAPWTLTGSRSGSGCRGTRCDGTGPHTCLNIRPGRQHSGAREALSIPLSASFEAKGSAKGFARGPPKSGTPGPSHEVGLDLQIPDSMDDVLKYEHYSREMSQQDSPVPDVNPEDIAEIVIDDSDDLDKTIEELQAPVVEPAPSKKRGRDEPVSSSPSRKCMAQEGETSAPPLEDDLPKGVRLEDIHPKRYDSLCSDHPWVHKVRCSLLGLEAGTLPSREDIDSSQQFIP